MAISSDSSDSQYNGNGVTVAFATGFYFTQNGHIRVTVTNASGVDSVKILGSDYTVVGARNELGGTVTMVVPPAVGEKLTLARDVPFTQEAEYPDNDPFSSQTTEDALDKLTMLCQQVKRAVDRSFRVRETDGALPEAALVLNSVFGVNASGEPMFLTPDLLKSFLNLTNQIFDRPMMTFANASERALAVPDYTGQLGTQRDTNDVYISNGVTAGAWEPAEILPGAGTIILSMLADGILSADTAGRLKMADGYITLAKIAAGVFTADATGRGKFASGFVNSALCASGLWNAIAPAGAVLQTIFIEELSNFSIPSTSIIPQDDTIPQITEGTQLFSQAITVGTGSKILIELSFMGAPAADSTIIWGFFVGSGSDAIYASESSEWAGRPKTIQSQYLWAAPSAGTYTISVRMGPSSAVNWRLNGLATPARHFGGKASSNLKLQEIKG